jgi:hypothetical protein
VPVVNAQHGALRAGASCPLALLPTRRLFYCLLLLPSPSSPSLLPHFTPPRSHRDFDHLSPVSAQCDAPLPASRKLEVPLRRCLWAPSSWSSRCHQPRWPRRPQVHLARAANPTSAAPGRPPGPFLQPLHLRSTCTSSPPVSLLSDSSHLWAPLLCPLPPPVQCKPPFARARRRYAQQAPRRCSTSPCDSLCLASMQVRRTS